MSDRVTVTIDAGVADVRLNRPDKINALDPAMFSAIVDAGERIKTDRSVRAVVLSGEGRGFCAGLDFASFQAMAGGGAGGGEGEAEGQRGREGAGEGSGRRPGGESSAGADVGAIGRTEGRITHLGQQAAWVWQEVPVPVIAAVHGVALGGGLQIALGADLRFVAPDARLSVLEIRWGLIPDMTGTVMLPRLVGLDVAKELMFTGRMVPGEEAVRLGLATVVTAAPVDDALRLARELAGRSPDALREGKRLLNRSASTAVADQFADERRTMASLIGSPNQVEAVKAYFDKREPVFADPS